MRDIVAPALGADFVVWEKAELRRCVARGICRRVIEVRGERAGRDVVLGGERIVGLWRRVVEVDVEEEGVFVVREALLELASDGTVRGADVAVDDLADNGIDVCDLG